MKADNIKVELIEWLTKLEDEGILISLLKFKKATESGDWTESLTDDQIESLQKGLSDFEEGKLMLAKDFWNSYGRKT